MTAEAEAILERLMRLDPRACVRIRPNFPSGPSRWYVDLGSVVAAHLAVRGWSDFFKDGRTPEEALENIWRAIIAKSDQAGSFFLRYGDCKPDEPIPGAGPQAWVRWSQEVNDWVDVPPTTEALAKRNIPADRIRSYRDRMWIQRVP